MEFIVALGWAPLPGRVVELLAREIRDWGAVNNVFEEKANCR
jgi:hypothetical protein